MQHTHKTSFQKIVDDFQHPGTFSSCMLELFLLANTVDEITDHDSEHIYADFTILNAVIAFTNAIDNYKTILDKGTVLNSKGELDTDYVSLPHQLPEGPEFETLISDFFQSYQGKKISHDLFWIYSNALLNNKVKEWDADKRMDMSLCVLFASQSILDLEACSKTAICIS